MSLDKLINKDSDFEIDIKNDFINSIKYVFGLDYLNKANNSANFKDQLLQTSRQSLFRIYPLFMEVISINLIYSELNKYQQFSQNFGLPLVLLSVAECLRLGEYLFIHKK